MRYQEDILGFTLSEVAFLLLFTILCHVFFVQKDISAREENYNQSVKEADRTLVREISV